MADDFRSRLVATPRVWWVTSPTYSYIEYVPGMEPPCGPTYDTTDWVEVTAATRREAVTIAVKGWLAEKNRWSEQNWCQQQRADNASPFTGVRAEPAECPHGAEVPVGYWDDGWEDEHDEWWCDVCRQEWADEAEREYVEATS
jgi:hypothetical protein